MRAAWFAVISGALVLLLVGCGGSNEAAAPEQLTGIAAELQDPGPVHVHGLGYDEQAKVLYLATHTGLFELADGDSKARRIGDSHQDTMGFTLLKPKLFLGSGHPDAREQVPPHLGLIRSTDRGRSWNSVSLLGKADFHVLRAQRNTIYGLDSTNERLLASTDSGRTWKTRQMPERLLDLAIDPGDPEHVLASAGEVLYRSENGGRKWQASASGVSGLLAWPSATQLFIATLDGAVLSANSAQGPWRARGSLGSPATALLATNDRTLFAALPDGTIKQSDDGAATWKVRSTP